MLVTNVRDYKIRLGIVRNEESNDLDSLPHSATVMSQSASRISRSITPSRPDKFQKVSHNEPTNNDHTYSKHTTMPDSFLLLAHPEKTFFLERQEGQLQVARLRGFLRGNNWNAIF